MRCCKIENIEGVKVYEQEQYCTCSECKKERFCSTGIICPVEDPKEVVGKQIVLSLERSISVLKPLCKVCTKKFYLLNELFMDTLPEHP